MHRILLLLCLLLVTTGVCAQKGYQDVIYLKNGSVVRGMVVEQVPGVSIKIETPDRSVFVFAMADVERITKETIERGAVANAGVSRGYQGLVAVGYGIGVKQYGLDRAKVDVVNGYRSGPHLMAGLGFGLRAYTGDTAATLLVPLFVQVRFHFLDRKITPYLAVQGGTAFDANDGFQTMGPLFGGELGVSIRSGKRTMLHFGPGFELQSLRTYREGDYASRYRPVERQVNSGAVDINVGLAF